MTPYQHHKQKWKDCKRCELHKRRSKVVLVRGTIPCDVLFVGEAPGVSEDVIGKPFVGPAGKLLDGIIEESQRQSCNFSFAITNLVACIPKDESNKKAVEPPNNCIRQCKPRLEECIKIFKPKLIIAVGKLSKKWLTDYETIAIVHPAAILRMDVSQKGLAYQRSYLTIADAVEENLISF